MERTQPETRKTPTYPQKIGVLWSYGSGDPFGRVRSDWAGRPVCTVHIRYSTYYIRIIDIILLQGTASKRRCPDLPPT